MKIERNKCVCGKKQLPHEAKNETGNYETVSNVIYCLNCFEVLSYERVDKNKFDKISNLNPTMDDFENALNEIRK